MSFRPRISSITVAFNPGASRLAQQLAALAGQVNEIVVVDNGSQPSIDTLFARHAPNHLEFREPALRVVTLRENEGIARGLNVGIDAARASGAEFVLLLDHDSVPARDMVELMVAAYRREEAQAGAARIAAMGPRVKDFRDAREYPFIRLGWLRNHHLRCGDAGDDVVECDFLISSGTLLPVASFDAIGPFEEDLFIDSVDREWCFRARAGGFVLKGVCAAQLDHRLGDHRRSVAGGIELIVHSPERLYYMTRNRMLLYQRAYVPLKWKLKDFLRVLAKFAATLALVAPRAEYARMTFRAIRDALARRGGKLSRPARG
jgi:rhamnosyltransferase